MNQSDDDEFSDSSDGRLNRSSDNIQASSAQHDLVKFLHKKKSPQTPTMHSLSHIKNITNNTDSSPFVSASHGKDFYQMGHHSTPTPKTGIDSLAREHLTLDLNTEPY